MQNAEVVPVSTVPKDDSTLTPLMRQYNELKSQSGEALLFFRMGDFYELFGDDAVVASKILDLTLTSRDKNKENALPMAGLPYHAATGYIQRLLECGKKVAIGEQVEDPEEAKKRGSKSIVRREIVRTFTPALQWEHHSTDRALIATAVNATDRVRWVIAAIEPSTGESFLSPPLHEHELFEECSRLAIRHFLRLGSKLPVALAQSIETRADTLMEDVPSHRISLEEARRLIDQQFETQGLRAFLPENGDLEASELGYGLLLQYLFKNQNRTKLPNLRAPSPLRASQHLRLGPKTVTHLDLLPRRDRINSRSLYEWCNETKTAMGGRLLREWILNPLIDRAAIEARQIAVKLIFDRKKAAPISERLTSIYDIERILGKVSNRLATPRDTRALAASVHAVLSLKPLLIELAPFSREFDSLLQRLDASEPMSGPLAEKILRIQNEDAPLLSRDGKIFKMGYQAELDRLIEITERGDRWLIDLEEKERARTGIPSLKVRYNRVFGYYIEVTTTHLKNVPTDYMRKQTTAGGERFFTEELKQFEQTRISADEKRKALELALFEELNAEIESASGVLLQLSESVARLDVLTSFSRYLDRAGPYVFPVLDESVSFEVENGRHPLVDKGDGTFIPNSLTLGHERTLLITGPNMGGKSTVMRQFAVLVLLGQMGAPIPASRAQWGVVDALFTRIGAEDAIFEGQSTFMVEMTELAHLLHHATARSFLILDEIGRGTSTYDGLSVAWSSIEWITNKIESRTLFATHYHELTELPVKHPKLRNAHLAVEQSKTGLRFLYELRPGPSSESFGIQVARLAGLPKSVIDRATQILRGLENGGGKSGKTTSASIDQLSLFSMSAHAEPAEPAVDLSEIQSFLGELQAFPVLDTSPMQALAYVGKIAERAKSLQKDLLNH